MFEQEPIDGVPVSDNQPGTPAFKYIDLFAGIGGFHAVLDAMGGECVYAVEIDPAAQRVYEANWGTKPLGSNAKGDITIDTQSASEVDVPEHDVLVAGFPCQPFSKSGAQRGMDETRGTLFFDILRIIEDRKPAVVLLENVRNLAGPRHTHEWKVIIDKLRERGYRVSSTPAILSPVNVAPEAGGHPQTRDRVFIAATRVKPERPTSVVVDAIANREVVLPDAKDEVEPISLADLKMAREWDLMKDLPLNGDLEGGPSVSPEEWKWIDHWDAFVKKAREMLVHEADAEGRPAKELPGFPIWANVWTTDVTQRAEELRNAAGMAWKVSHLTNNYRLYDRLRAFDKEWTATWLGTTRSFPESRQKLEWQAQWETSIKNCVISMRPSGLRVKRLTHLPALVAISQTPIIGPLKRRLTIEEGALLQGLPSEFSWAGQKESATWKQLGNGVNSGIVAQALAAQIKRDAWLLELDERGQLVVDAVRKTIADTGGDLREKVREAVLRGQEKARSKAESYA